MTRPRIYTPEGYRETTTGTALRLSPDIDLYVVDKGDEARKRLAEAKRRRG